MAASHAFLDILAKAPVRDAYLAGRVTLLLSADMATVLWANGAGAHFLGFRTVAESLSAPCRFDAVLRRRIAEAAAAGSAALLPGAGQGQRFLINRVRLAPWGDVVFLRSVAAAVGRNGLVDLTDGLSDETSEAVLLDLSGRIMAADKDFDRALAQDPGLPALLAEAFVDGAVKKRLLGGDKPYPVGVLRLNKQPPVFLMIAARRPPAAGPGAENNRVMQNMYDEDASAEGMSAGEGGERRLNRQEQEAFAVIARHLQQSLHDSPLPPAAKAAGPAVLAADRAAADGQGQQKAGTAAAPPPAEPLVAPAEPAAAPAAGEATAAAGQGGTAAAGEAAAPEAALADLRYQKNRLDFLLNIISEAVLLIDKTGAVRSGNAAAARLFGYAPAALPGMLAAQLLAPAPAAALRHDIKQAQEQQSGVFLTPGREAEGRTAQGALLRLRLNFGCIEPGETYVLLLRDMTRFHDIIAALLRKNTEEAQAALRQSRYFALISHEIRTPLNAISGLAQFMASGRAGAPDSGKYQDYLGDIVQASEHITALVNDILAVSRNKGEWPKMNRRPIALAAVLDEVLSLMIPQANAANIIMRSNLAADLPPVYADSRAVRQILFNLLGNAVHFTPAGGQIIISAHEIAEPAAAAGKAGPAGQNLLLRISDTGIGMSAGQIARALRNPLEPDAAEPEAENAAAETAAGQGEGSAQSHSRSSRDFRPQQGAGLGLSMAQTLAEANNIRFSLTSEPGKGTIAALLFSLAAARPVNAAAEAFAPETAAARAEN